jgi:hypothetical protein
MMETVNTSETSVNFYDNKRRSISEGCHLQESVFNLGTGQDAITQCKEEVEEEDEDDDSDGF